MTAFYLTKGQWLRAVYLWQRGRSTAEIADMMNAPESFIYNKLPHYRAAFTTIETVAQVERKRA